MQKTAFELGFETGLTKLGEGWQDYLGQAYNWLKNQDWAQQLWKNKGLRTGAGALAGMGLGGLLGGRKGALLGGALGGGAGYLAKGLPNQRGEHLGWGTGLGKQLRDFGMGVGSEEVARNYPGREQSEIIR